MRPASGPASSCDINMLRRSGNVRRIALVCNLPDGLLVSRQRDSFTWWSSYAPAAPDRPAFAGRGRRCGQGHRGAAARAARGSRSSARALTWSRLGESNPRPTHYEGTLLGRPELLPAKIDDRRSAAVAPEARMNATSLHDWLHAGDLRRYTLSQLAEGVGHGGRLLASRYTQLGGVRGTLARQADAALADATTATGRNREQVVKELLRTLPSTSGAGRRGSGFAATSSPRWSRPSWTPSSGAAYCSPTGRTTMS
jgi:hypothetical protein